MTRSQRPGVPLSLLVDLGLPVPAPDATALYRPPVDVVEYALGWRLVFEIPGAVQATLVVEAKERQVVVRGERRLTDAMGGRFLRVERAAGCFERALELTEDLDPDKAQASYNDGLLTLDIPKKAAPKGRSIPIKGNRT
jgi:HSP20 family protein